jgi:HEAT repeat protein
VKEFAADALGEIKDTRAVGPLIQALKDNDSFVRMSAAGALGDINDTRAVEPLIHALTDDNSGSVRGLQQKLSERSMTPEQ